jgi:hypothetical protein
MIPTLMGRREVAEWFGRTGGQITNWRSATGTGKTASAVTVFPEPIQTLYATPVWTNVQICEWTLANPHTPAFGSPAAIWLTRELHSRSNSAIVLT